jgi:hypothetical protein
LWHQRGKARHKSKGTESELIEFHIIDGIINTTMKDKTLLRYSNTITEDSGKLCSFMRVRSLGSNKNNRTLAAVTHFLRSVTGVKMRA